MYNRRRYPILKISDSKKLDVIDNILYYNSLDNEIVTKIAITMNNKWLTTRKSNDTTLENNVFYTTENTINNIGTSNLLVKEIASTRSMLKINNLEILFSLTDKQRKLFKNINNKLIKNIRTNMDKVIFNTGDVLSIDLFLEEDDDNNIYTFKVINIYGHDDKTSLTGCLTSNSDISVIEEGISDDISYLNTSNSDGDEKENENDDEEDEQEEEKHITRVYQPSKCIEDILDKPKKSETPSTKGAKSKPEFKSEGRNSYSNYSANLSSLEKLIDRVNEVKQPRKYVIENVSNPRDDHFVKSISDLEKLGIGGLNSELKELIDNLISRMIKPKLFEVLGMKHVKGIILHGPPGCGKTLIARHIGKFIGCKNENIKVVNGPEVLSPLVGGSEANVRALFADAEKNPSELHIIIFDEFDSIASKRNTESSTKHENSVVNQLLSKIDGVNQIDNILIIGITNRLDMLDPAIIRPGRFDLKLKIDIPSEKGRKEIIEIYIKSLRDNRFLQDVSVEKLAELTDGYSGADLELMVKNTINKVITKKIDYDDIFDSSHRINRIIITQEDFVSTIVMKKSV